MQLFRPVGVAELRLIAAAGWRAFPPRLDLQPIFYPVLTRDYAARIAREWNTRDPASGWAGFVTAFGVDDALAARFPVREVGGQACRELWVPAEELPAFNAALTGPIAVECAWYGAAWSGAVDPASGLPADVAAALPAEEASGDRRR